MKKKSAKQSVNDETKLDKKLKSSLPYIGFIVALVIIYFISSWIFGAMGKVTYEGLTFAKEKYGEIPVYRYSYYVQSPEGKLYLYNLFVRKNPAKNEVPMLTDGIVLNGVDTIYVSINGTGLARVCNDTIIAVASLSQFIANNFIKVRGGTPDREEAEGANQTYLDCNTYPESTTIKIQAADKTEIVQEGNCFIINSANCEVLSAVEKFIVQTVADATKRQAQN